MTDLRRGFSSPSALHPLLTASSSHAAVLDVHLPFPCLVECDPRAFDIRSSNTTADALAALRAAVGLSVSPNCPSEL